MVIYLFSNTNNKQIIPVEHRQFYKAGYYHKFVLRPPLSCTASLLLTLQSALLSNRQTIRSVARAGCLANRERQLCPLVCMLLLIPNLIIYMKCKAHEENNYCHPHMQTAWVINIVTTGLSILNIFWFASPF